MIRKYFSRSTWLHTIDVEKLQQKLNFDLLFPSETFTLRIFHFNCSKLKALLKVVWTLCYSTKALHSLTPLVYDPSIWRKFSRTHTRCYVKVFILVKRNLSSKCFAGSSSDGCGNYYSGEALKLLLIAAGVWDKTAAKRNNLNF